MVLLGARAAGWVRARGPRGRAGARRRGVLLVLTPGPGGTRCRRRRAGRGARWLISAGQGRLLPRLFLFSALLSRRNGRQSRWACASLTRWFGSATQTVSRSNSEASVCACARVCGGVGGDRSGPAPHHRRPRPCSHEPPPPSCRTPGRLSSEGEQQAGRGPAARRREGLGVLGEAGAPNGRSPG